MAFDEQLKKIKLIALDLDGTLLRTDGTIGTDTKKNINTLQELGVRFTFATGRLHSAITTYAEELNIIAPLISLDGSMIRSFPEGKVLFETSIKKRHVERALSLANRHFINIALCHADAIYFTEHNSVIPQVMEKFGAQYQEVESYSPYLGNTLEIVFAGDNKDTVKYLRDRLSPPYSFGLSHSYFKSQRHGGIFYLEVRRKGTSKGKGLQRLLKYFKLKPAEAAVIGDWYNDISLFNTGAFKVALNNAVAEIRRMADIVTEKDNDNDGVAEFLEKVIKAKT